MYIYKIGIYAIHIYDDERWKYLVKYVEAECIEDAIKKLNQELSEEFRNIQITKIKRIINCIDIIK